MGFLKDFKKGFKKGFILLGTYITIIINSFLLIIVYLLAVGITSVIAKIVGKKFLNSKIQKKKKSYWEDLNLTKKHIEEYYRQF